nr:hypothetical protein Iba_chr02dCG3020 [Ipomoea batatas]
MQDFDRLRPSPRKFEKCIWSPESSPLRQRCFPVKWAVWEMCSATVLESCSGIKLGKILLLNAREINSKSKDLLGSVLCFETMQDLDRLSISLGGRDMREMHSSNREADRRDHNLSDRGGSYYVNMQRDHHTLRPESWFRDARMVDSSSEMLLRLPARVINSESGDFFLCFEMHLIGKPARDSGQHMKLPTTMYARVLTIGFMESRETIVFSRKSPVIRQTNKILELATSRPFAWKAWSRKLHARRLCSPLWSGVLGTALTGAAAEPFAVNGDHIW